MKHDESKIVPEKESEDMLTKVSDDLHQEEPETEDVTDEESEDVEDETDEEEPEEKPKKTKELTKEQKDKLINIGIYVVLIIVVGVFVVMTILKPGKSSDQLPAIDSNQSSPDMFDQYALSPYATSPNVDSYGNLQVTPSNNMENNLLNDGYYVPSLSYTNPVNCNGVREDTYRISFPINYEMIESADNTIYMKPESFSIYVDGNDPIELRWIGISYMDQVRNGGTFTVDNKTIEVIDSYQYQFNETTTKTVYIIHMDISSTNEDDDGYLYNHRYIAIIDDNPVGIQYFTATIYQTPLAQFLNNRYPDVQTLVRAIFKPVE